MTPTPSSTRLSARRHGLFRDQVHQDALDTVEQLRDAGYEAYLVGGCVRDLLLGQSPKDFDVATNATPEEVRDLFRRSRLIGRRFQIVHVRYGRHIIEVSTFRRGHSEDSEQEDERLHADSGLILRDNVWGSLEEDATRRDFTVNALYYDPVDEEIRDFVGGISDLSARRLKFIGDTRLRLREDPVRLLRAVRFRAKLGFELDPEIMEALPDCARRLREIPPARLFDEVCKFFESGFSSAIWQMLATTPLRAALFPSVPPEDPLVIAAMANTDARVAEDKPVTPGFLLAVLLWRDYAARLEAGDTRRSGSEAAAAAASAALAMEHEIITIPRRFSQFVRDVWHLQPRLEALRPKSARLALEHPRFRAGYDFLVLRAATGEPVEEAAAWWTSLQTLGQEGRAEAIEALNAGVDPARKKRRKRKRKTRGAGYAATGGESDHG
ncbi:MAG TPA: polynucleotide adenylyltransferase PcnB [Gammaproteobacteria bacterium]|nr:polynucleotide adenylyltransferase PcnB [Gammaproteobacteria bacterium]